MSDRLAKLWVLAAVAFGGLALVSLALPKLSLLAALLTLIAFLAMPPMASAPRRTARLALAIAAVASVVSIVRFVVVDAAPSLIGAGNRAAAMTAVSRLREILFVQDVMRRNAQIDPDGDGVGSAALITELTGAHPLRGGSQLTPPLLSDAYRHHEATPIGHAVQVAGYFFAVCLPRAGGGWTARVGDPIDEEQAERRFVAYAWPAAAQNRPTPAYFIDQHERILASDNRAGTEPRYAGQFFPPPCDAALAGATRDQWQPWRGKRPRATLPGDR